MLLVGNFISLSPIDATTYFFGSIWGSAPVTASGTRRILVPRSGTITRVQGSIRVQTVLGTNEAVVLSLRLNDTTDTFLANLDMSVVQTILSVPVNVAVALDDFIEFKFVSPTWATNPTGVVGTLQALLV